MPAAIASEVDDQRKRRPLIRISCIALIKAVEDFHGRGFTSAIFADNSMNCSALDSQVYVGVGEDVAKAFGEPAQFDGWSFVKRSQTVNEHE